MTTSTRRLPDSDPERDEDERLAKACPMAGPSEASGNAYEPFGAHSARRFLSTLTPSDTVASPIPYHPDASPVASLWGEHSFIVQSDALRHSFGSLSARCKIRWQLKYRSHAAAVDVLYLRDIRTPASQLKSRARSNLLDCLEDAGLDPIVEGDPDYVTDAAPFNLRFNWKPAAVVYPTDSKDVAAAVKCGANNDVKVNARSGGHSYAAFALGGEDGHLTVSLDHLRHLSQDGDKVTFGTGNHLGDIALYLWENGKRAMAHGTCPYVGSGGHAGQGGFGLPSRAWGLLADQIQSLEIVTADGSILNASHTENEDLFWAATGAAASFGIITSFTATTHPAPDSVKFSYRFANYGAEQASKGLQAWQEFANDPHHKLDKAVGLEININPDSKSPNGVVFSINGVYYGADEATVNATFAPLLEKLGTPTGVSLRPQDWIASVLDLGQATGVDQLNSTLAPDVHDTFYATSTFVPAAAPMARAASDALFAYLYGPGARTAVEWFVIFDLYGGGDSAVSSRGADYNAFDARDALYAIQYYGTIPGSVSDGDGIAFVQGMKKAVESNQPETRFKEYVNYIDSTYTAEESHKRYYPTHTERLRKLKDKYDPKRVISFPQDF